MAWEIGLIIGLGFACLVLLLISYLIDKANYFYTPIKLICIGAALFLSNSVIAVARQIAGINTTNSSLLSLIDTFQMVITWIGLIIFAFIAIYFFIQLISSFMGAYKKWRH